MPVIQGVNEITFPAGEDLTSHKHRAGILNATGQVVGAGAGAYPQVIIMSEPDTAGLATNCHHVGSSMRLVVQLAGTVVINDPLTTEAAGDFVVGTSGDVFCLRALEAGATGELVMALVVPADVVA